MQRARGKHLSAPMRANRTCGLRLSDAILLAYAAVMLLFYWRSPVGVIICLAIWGALAVSNFGLPFGRGMERRARVGCCGGCGYDLRHSPERCPECGSRTEYYVVLHSQKRYSVTKAFAALRDGAMLSEGEALQRATMARQNRFATIVKTSGSEAAQLCAFLRARGLVVSLMPAPTIEAPAQMETAEAEIVRA